ncbi:Cytochrome c1 [Rubrivivax sp. A210]|uniref:cytochrome c1 n=1 Tax=Rubrivivax sp. A210 TaxID=2772301 RepID=UPI00191A7735|nr:cytochrome c1 [Rubrivivax sp. A210]CAD5369238.1 Cytochrome c1 [Rubrivivax sp. A210]
MTKTIRSLLASLLALAAFTATAPALANTAGPAWDKFPTQRMSDLAALQNGAKLFANYCLNCHAAAFMRFNRLRDIGLTEQQIKDNLIFTGVKVGETMKTALEAKDAKEWFGALPPDLTLITRSRADGAKGSGADYVYTYLRSYYRDDTKATGWNNLVFPSVGMPHALWQLQGQQRAVFAEEKDPHDPAKKTHVFKGFEPITTGTLSQAEYNNAVADLVAFLQWMGEPNQSARARLGVWVLIFLGFFSVIAWRLNASFWKDIK